MGLARRNRTRILALAAFAAAAGCREAQPPPPATSAPAAVPGASMTGGLPSGHPPVGGEMRGGHGGAPVGMGGLSWTKPAEWKEETPSSGMRRAQYRVDGPGGEAECAVFYFGAGEGGDPQANAERWASQFTRADGKPAELKTSPLKAGPIDVTLVEVEGTYHGGPTMGAAAAPGPKSDSMLLGAIAKGPDANWFFKFTGPRKTVNGQRAVFEGMLRSLKTQ